jgi:GNAT superfamily N-acetyltransferase
MQVVPFNTRLAPAFAALNREWIERLFTMEAADVKLLDDPEAIIRACGQIYFAVVDAAAIGTAAAIVTSPTRVELAKMAVAPRYQGRGIGQALGERAIAWARDEYRADTMFLETNSSLEGAIRLYERLGFVRRSMPPDSEYARADVYMELALRRDDGNVTTLFDRS